MSEDKYTSITEEDLTNDQSSSNLRNYKKHRLLEINEEIEQRRLKFLQELDEEKEREIIKINSDVLGSLKDHQLEGIYNTVHEALYVSAKVYELEKNLETVINKWKFSLTEYKSLEHKTPSEFESDDLAKYNKCIDYAKDISTLRKFTNKYINIFDNLQETINLFETERDLDPQIFDLELENLVELHKSDSMSQINESNIEYTPLLTGQKTLDILFPDGIEYDSNYNNKLTLDDITKDNRESIINQLHSGKRSITNYLSNHDDIDYSTIDRMAYGILTTYTKFIDLDIYASQLLSDGTIPREFCPVEHINFEEFEDITHTSYHG